MSDYDPSIDGHRRYWRQQMRAAMEAGRKLRVVMELNDLSDRERQALHLADLTLCDVAQSAADEADMGGQFFSGPDWAEQVIVDDA